MNLKVATISDWRMPGMRDCDSGMTGMLHELEEVAAASIDLLVAQLQKNESGIPENRSRSCWKGYG